MAGVDSAGSSRGSGVDEPARASALQVIYSRENQHAASELRRYLYLITAELPALTLLEEAGPDLQLPSAQQEQLPIVLAGSRAGDPLAHALLAAIDAGWSTAALGSAAGEHDHVLRTNLDSSTAVVCHGATTLATRYAVYSLLETLGVGFRLHGQDAVPRLRTSDVVEQLRGLPQQQNLSPGAITTRGIQPFHDFSEGPDQWNEDDYKAHLEQLTKLKLNFIGLHTYPYREPTVWTGLPDKFDPQTGEVNISYNTSYMTTRGGGDWGGVLFNSTNSSMYTFGSDQILAGGPKTPECYGSDLLDGHGSCLLPSYGTAQQANELFNSVGQMLTNAFKWAKRVGVKTCVGTEAEHSQPSPQKRPPSIPTQAKQTELYIGIFERLLALGTPLDYYWIWTSEGWPARTTFPHALPLTDPSVANVVADFRAADAAKKAVGARMDNTQLATCGWTLGPGADRTYFDKVLPAGWTLSSINEAVGNTPTEAAYANVTKHEKWAIPWLEDDPGLLAPQLWVNRTLEYSAQAAGYGVNGLLGIHWRVREVAPQLSALARYPWERNITSLQVWEDFFASEFGGGGSTGTAAAAAAAIAKQAAQILSSVDSFKLPRPDNWIGGPGGIVQNTNVTACNALDGSTKESEYAFVEAFHALRPQLVAATTKGNNGTSSAAAAVLARYEFWAESLEYMRQMALVGCHWDKLQRCIDKLPSTCTVSLKQQLSHNQCVKGKNFACVGPSMWSYCRGVFICNGETVRCDNTGYCPCAPPTQPPSNATKAAAMRCMGTSRQLMNASAALTNALLATVETTGTIGSVENLMQHSFPGVLGSTDALLESLLGGPLPPDARPSQQHYTGKERLFMVTARQSAARGEVLTLRAYVLTRGATDESMEAPLLHYRLMGSGSGSSSSTQKTQTQPWTTIKMARKMAGRGVFTGALPAIDADMEYYVSRAGLVWPASAPLIPHTVVVL